MNRPNIHIAARGIHGYGERAVAVVNAGKNRIRIDGREPKAVRDWAIWSARRHVAEMASEGRTGIDWLAASAVPELVRVLKP